MPTDRPTEKVPHDDIIISASERGDLRRYLAETKQADKNAYRFAVYTLFEESCRAE